MLGDKIAKMVNFARKRCEEEIRNYCREEMEIL